MTFDGTARGKIRALEERCDKLEKVILGVLDVLKYSGTGSYMNMVKQLEREYNVAQRD